MASPCGSRKKTPCPFLISCAMIFLMRVVLPEPCMPRMYRPLRRSMSPILINLPVSTSLPRVDIITGMVIVLHSEESYAITV